MENTNPHIIVEHNSLGKGEILDIDLDLEDALIAVQWDSGNRGCYWADELEFLGVLSNG